MNLDQWILALHVLSAFALVGAMVLFWIVIVATRNVDTVQGTLAIAPTAAVGSRVVGLGALGTLVFGIWLAVALDQYQLWDGWIIAAIVVWAIGTGTGARGGQEFAKALTRARELDAAGAEGQAGELRALNRSPAGLRLHTISSAAALLVLVLMIWKPGS